MTASDRILGLNLIYCDYLFPEFDIFFLVGIQLLLPFLDICCTFLQGCCQPCVVVLQCLKLCLPFFSISRTAMLSSFFSQSKVCSMPTCPPYQSSHHKCCYSPLDSIVHCRVFLACQVALKDDVVRNTTNLRQICHKLF